MKKSKRLSSGFTLIEMIIVIVLLGIVSVTGIQLISPIFTGYMNTKTTDLLFSEAKFAVERISRELRQALPNSVRLAPKNGLQFCLFDYSSYYSNTASEDNISVDNSGSFNILEDGNKLSIYNTNENNLYSNDRVYTIDGKEHVGGIFRISLDKDIVENSPYSRYFRISTPITYYLDDNTLFRSFNYALNDGDRGTDPTASNTTNILIKDVQALTFTYSPGTLQRNAVVDIVLVVGKDGVQVTYDQRVHFRNKP